MKKTFKQFRELLNAQSRKYNYKHKNGKYHQQNRDAGDYLYFQDRPKFDFYFRAWVEHDNEWQNYI